MATTVSMNRPDSRRKGADGERELARVLADHLGIEVTRNLLQVRQGGHDLVGLPVALEVKRYATASPAMVERWWNQAAQQATGTGLVPALAYRVDRQPWRFVVPLSLIVEGLPFDPGYSWAIETSLPAFCLLVRETITTPGPGR